MPCATHGGSCSSSFVLIVLLGHAIARKLQVFSESAFTMLCLFCKTTTSTQPIGQWPTTSQGLKNELLSQPSCPPATDAYASKMLLHGHCQTCPADPAHGMSSSHYQV
jgi:hypothetical protein